MKKIKEEFFIRRSIIIDFNLHIYNELPDFRNDLFWHNNRNMYIQKELELYGLCIIGKNPFALKDELLHLILPESVKIINSLNYQARKLLINSNVSESQKLLMVKWCLYGIIYTLASFGVFPKTRKSAVLFFNKKFKPSINPIIFFELKKTESKLITNKDLSICYEFLIYLDNLIYSEYEKSKR